MELVLEANACSVEEDGGSDAPFTPNPPVFRRVGYGAAMGLGLPKELPFVDEEALVAVVYVDPAPFAEDDDDDVGMSGIMRGKSGKSSV